MGVALLGGAAAWRRLGRPQLADLAGWQTFSPSDVALLDEVAECIIPATNTPGAKAAGVGAFIALAVSDCYEPMWQSAFVFGLREIERRARASMGVAFAGLSPEQRVALLSEVEGDQRWRELWNRGERGLRILARPIVGALPPPMQVPHYLTMLKELTILGYFTSRTGATEALRHDPVPGSYEGNLPYRRGDGAWSQ